MDYAVMYNELVSILYTDRVEGRVMFSHEKVVRCKEAHERNFKEVSE